MPADTIVCVASGESLTQADVDFCKGRARVLVVNENWRRAPWANWLYACDAGWWHRNRAARVSGEHWTMGEEDIGFGLRRVRGAPGCGLSLDPTLVFWGGVVPIGGNSGAQAVQLAYHFGARRQIVLLGYDMVGRHWHEDHPGPNNNPTEAHFAHWREAFKVLAADLAVQGVELVNCSRNTTLQGIRRAELREVL